jgi:hypothetical protein
LWSGLFFVRDANPHFEHFDQGPVIRHVDQRGQSQADQQQYNTLEEKVRENKHRITITHGCGFVLFLEKKLVFHPIGIAVDAIHKQRKPFVARSYLFLIRKRLGGLALATLNNALGNIHDGILDEIVLLVQIVPIRGERRVVPTHVLWRNSKALGSRKFVGLFWDRHWYE